MYGGTPGTPDPGYPDTGVSQWYTPRYRGIPAGYPDTGVSQWYTPRYRGIPVVYPRSRGPIWGYPPGIPYPWDCPIKGSSRHGSGGTPRSGGYPQDPHSRKSSLGGGPWGPRSIASGALYCTPGTNFFGERGSSRHGSKAKMGQSSEVCLGALS